MLFWKKFNRERFSDAMTHWRSRLRYREQNNGFEKQRSALWVIFWLGVLSFLVTWICFYGQDLIWMQFVPNTKSRVQVIAEVPFEYKSKIKTDRLREQRRNFVAPVYSIDTKVYDNFENDILRLDELLDTFPVLQPVNDAERFEIRKFVRQFNDKNDTSISATDIEVLISGIDECTRTSVLLEGLAIVRSILYDGVFDASINDDQGNEYFLNIEIEGSAMHSRSRLEVDATRYFQRSILTIEAPPEVLQAVFRLLKTGIRPNIVFDNAATTAKIMRVVQETPEVIEKIFKGTVLADVGSMVTEEDYERILEYRKTLKRADMPLLHGKNDLLERFGITFAVLLLVFLFFKTSKDSRKMLQKKEVALVIVLLLFNLLLCRLVLCIFEVVVFDSFATFQAKITASVPLDQPAQIVGIFRNPICFLPVLLPLTLSCLLGTLLLRTYIGLLLGLVTAIFSCLMISQSAEFLIMAFAVVYITVYFVRHSYTRSQIIRSGYFSGLALVLMSLTIGIGMKLPRDIIIVQVVLAFFNGLSISMLASAILPFFENIFKCCTNIYLVELTDYSNPILAKLQILAPGTYHHSLMVANLSEQAAISIHANPFLCRTLSLYHDIGKMAKPEYFTENQSSNKNPHDEKTPFMSALIIKSHVKEGVEIAKSAGLPPRIIDGIMEHHGTTIIRYFYSKALKLQEMSKDSEGNPVPLITSEIEKSAFKYDGPRPRSKETLILSIADSIEAASRSLYNPTPQSIKTLVNKIINGKFEEGQFDECAITFKDIEELRQSFYFTLLNMMHSRVSYDDPKA